MKLYFKASRRTGYPLQMVLDTEARTVQTGYCLFIFRDAVKVTKKELTRICNEALAAGYAVR